MLIEIGEEEIWFLIRTLDFGEFLLLLANYQHEEQDDYDELNLAFQLFDLGMKLIHIEEKK